MINNEEYCCEKCFEDEFLQEHIRKEGVLISECSYCGAEESYGVTVDSIREMFLPIINLYTTVTNFYPMEYLKEKDLSDSMIWNKLTNDWGIFSDENIAESILNSMFSYDTRKGEYVDFLEDAVDIEEDWYGNDEHYITSKSWESFCEEIKHGNRFFPTSFNQEILEVVAKANKKIINEGHLFYRARIEEDKKIYNIDVMGAPPPDKTKYGRMNPQGISYLYLSSDLETCVAEVRPSLTDTISVGVFKVKKQLKLVDVINPFIGSPFKYKNDFTLIYTAKGFLKSLGNTLMLPIDPRNSYLEYLPSQYVCEFIKSLGYDGLIYKSTVLNGLNYILFEQINVECFKVNQVIDVELNYKFKIK